MNHNEKITKDTSGRTKLSTWSVRASVKLLVTTPATATIAFVNVKLIKPTKRMNQIENDQQ